MAVTKHKDADWQYYLDQIVQSGGKVSDTEMQEFAGFLLKRDMLSTISAYSTFRLIMKDQCDLAEKLISCLVAESPETISDLVQELKGMIVSFYKDEIKRLIDAKIFLNYQEDDGA